MVGAFETALPNEIAAVVRGLYDNGAGLDAVVAQMDALVASASPEAKAAMGRQLMADGHAWQANPDGYDKDVVARMMTLGRAYADATARLGQDPYGKQIERTLSVITEDYSAYKERLQVYQANIGAWTDMDLPYTMWTYFGNIARYEGTEVNVFAPADGVRAVAPTYNPETGEIGFAQNDDGSLRQSVTVKEIESADSLVIFGIDPSSGEITIQEGVQLNLGMNKALSMANPTPAPQPTQIQAPEAQPPESASPEDGVQLSLLDQTSALVRAFETGQPMDVAAAVQSLYATGAGLDSVVAQMDNLVANASPEAKAAMGRQLMADGHAWQANPDGYDKDVVARMMTLGRAYADATARLGQDPYGNQIERTLSVITEDYSAFKERLQVYQANIGAWTDMDLPYTMWTYFGNIARYEGTEVNVFAPADGVRAVAPTYNPETGEIGFAQNDDGSLRQSVTVKEIESAESLVIFGIDPSSGAITIQEGVQLNLGMNKALSMANPTPAPAQVPAVEAPEAQRPTTASPEDAVQLSIFDADAGRAAPEQSTRDIGLAPESDTDADGRKATVVGSDQSQSPPKPDLSVTPPEETDQVVQPTVAQENVATAPPTSPLFQQLRGIVASMLYDVPEAAPAIAETMGLSAEGLQLLRDNDNAQSWADLTAAGLSDADRAALQHAAALKLVSTLDPDQPASLFLSWFDWHIGTQADFTITQPHLQNAINMDNAGMDEVAAVMGLANFKRLVLSTHGLPGGQIMKTEEGAGFNIYDARIMAELAERAGVNSVLLAHCYGALGADGVNTLDVGLSAGLRLVHRRVLKPGHGRLGL
ncbi:MAG: hypothetical protein IPN01_15945 [Deltaproteobacteria bacterium]|nr:hypothetical protein [Deltaproteobacteria bacterium]